MAGSYRERFSLTEYTSGEIELAKGNFSERVKLRAEGIWDVVYKGHIGGDTVAIKFLSLNDSPEYYFKYVVEFFSNIRHPNLLGMLGFCTELKCLVYEYVDIENSTLQDVLISSADDNTLKKKLQWQDRIRIAAEIGSALCYLHQLQPEATGHGKLTASNVFIDSNLVVKVDFVQLSTYSKLYVIFLDVKAFGKLMNLLTGFSGEIDYSLAERLTLIRSLKETAGQWPQDLAEKLVDLSRSCNSILYNSDVEFYMETVKTELEEIRKKAEGIVSPCAGSRGLGFNREDSNDEIPSAFLCPIYQEVMKDPHVAADGFCYEREAIEKWLKGGHDTSPLTNLKLQHEILIPCQTLLSLITDWHCERSIPYP